MAYRRTARLRLRKPDSCCETCRLVEETNAGLLGRRASLGPAGCRNGRCITGLRSLFPRALWKCPACGRPVGVVLNLKVGQAGAHSPLEISRATAADHACAGAARFPHFHSASSSIPIRKPRSPSTCHDVNPKALTRPRDRGNLSAGRRDFDVRRFETVTVGDLLVSTSGASLRLVIPDACRNNPFLAPRSAAASLYRCSAPPINISDSAWCLAGPAASWCESPTSWVGHRSTPTPTPTPTRIA